MAFGTPQKSTLMLWYTAQEPATVRVAMPVEFDDVDYSITLFDEIHNNPAGTSNTATKPWLHRSGGDLVMDIKPFSLLLLTSNKP